jgi:orotidine-5'-phosphate decarboxylase
MRAAKRRDSLVVLGIDPVYQRIPRYLRARADAKYVSPLKAKASATYEFCDVLIRFSAPHVCAVKFQVAFFEVLGSDGIRALEKLLAKARRRGLITIVDCKRGDIGTTTEAYAQAYFGRIEDGRLVDPPLACDAVTLNPYLGTDTFDAFRPYFAFGKGVFVLVKTSNPGAKDLQDRLVAVDDAARMPVHHVVAEMVKRWGADYVDKTGYSAVGAVVGATQVADAKLLRGMLPSQILLVPGMGTQGGKLAECTTFLDGKGKGAIFNFSRDIMYAFEKHAKEDPDGVMHIVSSPDEAKRLKNEINGYIAGAGAHSAAART